MSFLNRFKLNGWVDAKEHVDEVMSLVDYVTTNPDMPTLQELNLSQEEVERVQDCLNYSPTYTKTADNKHRCAEYILPTDLTDGDMSPAAPLLYCLLPVLACIASFFIILCGYGVTHESKLALCLGGLGLLGATVLSFIIAWSLGMSLAGKVQTFIAWGVGFIVPMMLGALALSDPSMTLIHGFRGVTTLGFGGAGMGIMGMMGFIVAIFTTALTVCVLLAIGCLLVKRGQKLETCIVLSQNVLLLALELVVLTLLAAILSYISLKLASGVMTVLPYGIAYCLGPVRMVTGEAAARRGMLMVIGSYFKGENLTDIGIQEQSAAKQENFQRITTAAKDTSKPLLKPISTGVLYKRGSPRAVPKGIAAVLTMKGAETHLLATGKTGSGKSTSAAIIIIDEWDGGYILIDGKNNELAQLYKGRRGYTLIDEFSRIAPFEGLDVDAVVGALLEANKIDPDKEQQGSGNSSHFNKRAEQVLRALVTLLFALAEAEKNHIATRKSYATEPALAVPGAFDRKWFVTPECLEKLKQRARAWHNGYSKILELLDYVAMWHPSVIQEWGTDEAGNKVPSFNFKTNGKAMVINDQFGVIRDMGQTGGDSQELQGVFVTIDTMTAPLFGNERLRHWASTESGGFQFETVLYGAGVGFGLSKDEFGRSATFYTTLCRQRVMRAIKKARLKGWRERDPRQKQVLMCIDEFHSRGIVASDFAEFSSKCRGWGVTLFCLTQSIESLYESMGEEATNALIQNFQTQIFFHNPNSALTMQHAIKICGKGVVTKWVSGNATVNLLESAKEASYSMVRNNDHPNAAYFRKMRRMGAGGFRYLPGESDGMNSQHTQVLAQDRDTELLYSKVNLVESYKSEIDNWLTEPMLADTLIVRGCFFMQFIRGGTTMHEIVQGEFREYPKAELMLKPGEQDAVFDLPADLLPANDDHDPVTKEDLKEAA